MSSARTDHDLLARYAATRDAEAFTELVTRHAAMVHAACRRVCGVTAAEDVAQEVFLALARHAGRIRESVGGWLHVVATREAVRIRRRGEVPLDQAPEPLADEHREELGRLEARLDAALVRLTDELRAPLVLHFLEGRSQLETATVLALSQPTVHRRIAEGIVALRTLMERDDASLRGSAFAAMLAAVPCPPVPASVVAAGGRIALGGITPLASASAAGTPVMLMLAVVATAIGAAVFWAAFGTSGRVPLTGRSELLAPASLAATATGLADPPATADDVLDRPCEFTMAEDRVAVLCGLVDIALHRAGHPGVVWSTVSEQRVVAIARGSPLRSTLDAALHPVGLRWTYRPGCLLIDRPLGAVPSGRCLDALRTAGAGTALAAARDIVWSGDLDLVRQALALIADIAPATSAALVRAIFERLPMTDEAIALPLPLDDAVVAAVARRWQRLRPDAVTVADLVLVGLCGAQDARPRLRAILDDPDAALTPMSAVMRDQFRGTAGLALGWLHDTSAADAITRVARAHGDPSTLPLLLLALARLGRLPDPALIFDRHAASEDECALPALYAALAHSDPTEAQRFIAARRAALGDGGVSYWFTAFATDPVPALAAPTAALFASLTSDPDDQECSAFVFGMLQLAPEVVLPAVASSTAAQPRRQRAMRIAAAFAGDPAAQADVVDGESLGLDDLLDAWVSTRRLPQVAGDRVAGTLHALRTGDAGDVRASYPMLLRADAATCADAIAFAEGATDAVLSDVASFVPAINQPRALIERQAALTLKALRATEAPTRRAGIAGAREWLLRVGPWSVDLLQGLLAARDDARPDIRDAAREALDAWDRWFRRTAHWPYRTWCCAVAGYYDDRALMARLEMALGDARRESETPQASSGAAADHF